MLPLTSKGREQLCAYAIYAKKTVVFPSRKMVSFSIPLKFCNVIDLSFIFYLTVLTNP